MPQPSAAPGDVYRLSKGMRLFLCAVLFAVGALGLIGVYSSIRRPVPAPALALGIYLLEAEHLPFWPR